MKNHLLGIGWVPVQGAVSSTPWPGLPRPARGAPRRGVRLYTLDGGHLEFKNMGHFADSGEHEG